MNLDKKNIGDYTGGEIATEYFPVLDWCSSQDEIGRSPQPF